MFPFEKGLRGAIEESSLGESGPLSPIYSGILERGGKGGFTSVMLMRIPSPPEAPARKLNGFSLGF